jgi:hypothetical protein
LASLRDFTPKFLGTLNLEGKIDQENEIHPVDSIQKDISFIIIIIIFAQSSHRHLHSPSYWRTSPFHSSNPTS